MIMKSADSFLPGQYSYPFSFQMPVGMPGTYVHESGHGDNHATCSCSYTLYCELLNGYDTIGRASCPIVVMQQARTQYCYDVPIEINKTVKT